MSTSFFGASVIDFSASAGWGAQSSEVTINLAADCAEAFQTPVVGQAATFVMGSFSFTGLVQSWNSKAGSDGNPLYSVKLISPHPILDNTQVILDHYEGAVPFYNIANVYGYLESTGGGCPWQNIDGTMFGAPAGGFGNANRTDRGIPWYMIKSALQALTGGAGGGSAKYCKGLGFKGQSYILDISDVPIGNKNYRITGPVVSLTDLITQVCEDAGCDYYIQMFPSFGIHVIKVVVIARTEQPALGAIASFVTGQNVISNALGKELRSEINSSLLIGGKVKQYFQCTDTNKIAPFWGWDAEGDLIESKHGGGVLSWQVKLDFRKINLALTNTAPNFMWIGENELRAAAADYESFFKNILNPTNSDSELYNYYKNTLKFKLIDVDKKDPAAGNAAVDIRISTEDDDLTGDPASKELRDAKAVHNWLNSYSTEFYGKKFLVCFSTADVICMAKDDDTKQTIYSDIVSTDGAWPSKGNTFKDAGDILGLNNPSSASDLFKDDTGKVQPLVKFGAGGSYVPGQGGDAFAAAANKKKNTKGLNIDDFIIIGDNIWIKADVDGKYVDGLKKTKCALITLSNGVIDTESDVEAIESNRPIDVFTSTGKPTTSLVIAGTPITARKNLGGQGQTVGALGPSYLTFPTAIGVPMESTTASYGPWYAAGADPGSAHVEVDDGLVPWEYGGFKYMNKAGIAKIESAYTHQQEADRGEVTVPGLPTLSLANNIGGGGVSSAFNLGVNTIGGAKSSFYSFGSSLTGGAVISNISVSVGSNGVTTTYTVNSFTPVFGRFSKGNADRLKQIGLNKHKNEREMRARAVLKNLIRASESKSDGQTRMISESIGRGPISPMSPGVAFAGKMLEVDGESIRKIVLSPTKNTTPFYTETEAQQTSVMTMDGFFRPVQSKDGIADNLPKVADPIISPGYPISNQTSGPPPPVKDSSGAAVEPLDIYTKYLNFLENPGEDLSTRGAGTARGHDIEGVSRGEGGSEWASRGADPGRLLMQSGAQGEFSDYSSTDDYRFMALRGPLVIHGWGYDTIGKPIPNEVDSTATSFASRTDLTDKFKANWLSDSNTWPVAPVDLRFDRERNVWTVPPSFRMYQVIPKLPILAGAEGRCTVEKDKGDILKSDGGTVSGPEIDVVNWTQSSLSSGVTVLAYYDTAEQKYWVIAGPSGSSGVVSLGATGCTNDLECQELTDSGCLIFGSGLYGEWKGESGEVGNDFLVSGPKIGQNDNGCSGYAGSLPPLSFEELMFGSGLKLSMVDGSTCKYLLDACPPPSGSGMLEVGAEGCGNDVECDTIESGCLIFSTGLYGEWKGGVGNDFVVSGPKIGSNSNTCGAEVEAKPFAELLFGAGLKLELEDAGECKYVLDTCLLEVGATGCDNNVECSGISGCLIFGSGLYGEWICNTDFLITGPKVSYGGAACGGEDGDAESFDHLTFTSGLTAVKASDDSDECSWIIGGPIINQEGCGAAPGPDYGIQKLIIGSGLKLTPHSGGNPCWHVISGPELGGAVDSEGAPVGMFGGAYAEPFRELWAGLGIKLLQTDESLCKYEISTTFEVGATGCGNDVECSGISGCLVFSSGLEGEWKGGVGNDFYVTGPRIDAALCGADTIDKPFTKLIFTSGMHVSNVEEGEEETCEYKISGPTIENKTCGTSAESTPIALGNLIIGSGLSFSDGEDCEVTIGGAKIGSNGEEADFFDHLVVGKGLLLTEDDAETDKCQFTLEADEREVGATGCGNDVECTGMSGCLVFSSGLYGYWKDAPGGDFWVEGPKVGYSGSDCGDDIAGEPFDQLIFTSGLTAAKLTEDGCSWVVGGPLLQKSVCNAEPQEPVAFNTLRISTGLHMTSLDSDEYTAECLYVIEGPHVGTTAGTCGETKERRAFELLSFGTGLNVTTSNDDCFVSVNACLTGLVKIGSTGCKTESECSGYDCLIVGDGLSLVAGNQIHGPQIHGAAHSCGGSVAGSAFTQLYLGSGLQLSQPEGWDQYCLWQIDVCQTGLMKIGSTGCGTESECSGYDCLIVGDGLSLVEGNQIQGPKIDGNIFTDITLEGGLSIVVDEVEKCTYTLSASGVSGTQIRVDNATACPDSDQNITECTGLTCLTVGKDLQLNATADKPDGHYTIASCASGTSGLQIGSTGCGTESECSGYDCLIVGDGLSLVAGNQIRGPKIDGKYFANTDLENLTFTEKPGEEGKCHYVLTALTSGSTQIRVDNATACPDSDQNITECTGLTCLTVGKDLKLTENGGGAGHYTLASCASASGAVGVKLGSTGCGTEVECGESIHECLIVGDGLSLVALNQIHGPKLGTKRFADFELEGLIVDEIDPIKTSQCIYKLKAAAGSGVSIKTDGSCGGDGPNDYETLTKLNITTDLKLDGSDGEYTLSSCAAGGGGGGGGCTDGVTSGVKVVSDVCCSGATFVVMSRTLTFTSGCLVGVEDETECPC